MLNDANKTSITTNKGKKLSANSSLIHLNKDKVKMILSEYI